MKTIKYFLFSLIISLAHADSFTDLSVADKLQYSTVRLEATFSNSTALGTAFYFELPGPTNRVLPVIVTCRHVVEGALVGKFQVKFFQTNGLPEPTKWATAVLSNFASLWTFHPDTNVDLAVMPIAPLLHALKDQGFEPCYAPFNGELIPSAEEYAEFGPLTPIVLIGYPIGLMDEVHSLPILRKGVTATDPKIDYNGRKQFVIDAPCFPGSSGSPILSYEAGMFPSKGQLYHGDRLRFMGILFAGPQFTVDGTIVVVNIPTAAEPHSQSRIPANLGFVIKPERLMEIGELLIKDK